MDEKTFEQLDMHKQSKYTLVVAAAKRARQLLDDGAEDEPGRIKPVTQALSEIQTGKLYIDRRDTGPK